MLFLLVVNPGAGSSDDLRRRALELLEDVRALELHEVSSSVARSSARSRSPGPTSRAAATGVFANNLSIGLYPEPVQQRERREDRWGRWMATSVAAVGVLRRFEPLVGLQAP